MNKKLISIPELHTLDDVRQVLAKTVNDLQTSIISQLPIVDYAGARIQNVGAPQAADDVVTLKFLQSGAAHNVQPSSILVSTNTANNTSGIPPWYTVTDPTLTTFVWRNQGGATCTTRTKSYWLHAPATAGDQIRGREIVAPSTPWSITAGVLFQAVAQNYLAGGIYVTDGTKLITYGFGYGASGLPVAMGVSEFNSVSSFNSTLVGPNALIVPTPVFLKVVDDGTNLTWSWGFNGLDFLQVYQGAKGAFLTGGPTAVGFYSNSNNATWDTSILLVSWAQGTS